MVCGETGVRGRCALIDVVNAVYEVCVPRRVETRFKYKKRSHVMSLK